MWAMTETVTRSGRKVAKRIPLRIQAKAADLVKDDPRLSWDMAVLKAWILTK
jgi:hypothetical protein